MRNLPSLARYLGLATLFCTGFAACDDNASGNGSVTDAAQEVSSLCPPDNRPEATQEATAASGSMCLTVFEKKAFDLLATAEPVGTSEACGLTPPYPLCFIKLTLSRPVSGGVFGVAYEWYKGGSPPQRFEFDTCSEESGRCEFDGHIGVRPVKVMYDVDKRTFEINDAQLFLSYKLVDK